MSTPIDNTPATEQATHPQEAASPRKHNTLARVAFAGAVIAQALYIASAAVNFNVSKLMGPVSAIVALVSLVMGLIALRRRPRNLAVGACVLSGVIVLIFILLLCSFMYVRAIIDSTAN